MSSSEVKLYERKTTTLGINKIPENASIITIAQACEGFISNVKGIKIIKFRSDNSRNALIDFITPKQCEEAKEMGDLKIGKESFPLYYAKSQDSQSFNMIASEDKLYIKYPEEANESDVIKMLGDVSIKRPENAKNYFFATCRDIEQQCSLVKNFNKKKIGNGELTVKVAIDKTKKSRVLPKKIASN